ncbi:MAG: hypothetical protein WKG01_28925 [Kofleriaceae bacterium]
MRTIAIASLLVVAAVASARAEPTAEELTARKAALDTKLQGQGYTVLVEAPFVIIGDEAAARVRSRASGFFRRTVKMLEQDFFNTRPAEIIEVWLFRNEKTYRKGAKKFFDDEPETPYGYYSPEDSALIMNIGPGPGTLSHELVHPYIEANFPASPAWFNEGLASLYEQPAEHNGHIWGNINWRLPNLKRQLKDRSLPALHKLLSTTRDGFYQAHYDSYAYARYLIQYVQDAGKLPELYVKFVADTKDPTGKAALEAVLGEKLETFEPKWRKWALALNRN